MLKNRKAIAMIELIFALVVMGIAMLAIPIITSQSTKGSESAMMQESISQVAANMNVVLAKYWDDANTNSNNERVILKTDSTTNFGTRAGLTSDNGRINYDQLSVAPADASNVVTNSTAQDPEGSDDMSDFNGKKITLSVYEAQENKSYEGDYIDKDISLTTTVTFAPDAVTVAGGTLTYDFDPKSTTIPASSSNIKRVNVLLETTNENQVSQNGKLKDIKKIQLNGFSCNIGAAVPKTI